MFNDNYNDNKKNMALLITQGGVTAALYIVLTLFSAAFSLASGVIQVRLSEMLCVLPVFTPAAIPGLFVGCLLSNALTGAPIYDVVFGSIATLIGAFGTYALRNKKFIYTLPPVISNGIIVPLILRYAYNVPDAFLFLVLTVSIGELISVSVFGTVLKNVLWRFRFLIFKNEKTNI